MKTLYILALCLVLVGCDKFDRDNLIKSSFGADLERITSGKKTQYSDGLFLVFDVTDTDPLYAQFFTKPFDEEEISLFFGNTKYDSADVGKIRYRLLDSFDGFTKTIFYIPKLKLLGFGYSDGLLG